MPTKATKRFSSTRRIMEEQEYDALNEAYWQNALARSRKEHAQTRKVLTKALAQKDKALTQKDKVIEELQKKLGIN